MTGRHNVGRVFTRAEIWLFLHISLISCGTINSSVASYPFPSLFFFSMREKGESHKEVKWSDTNLHIHWMRFFSTSKFFLVIKTGVRHILMLWYFAYGIFCKCVLITWLLPIDRLHVYDDEMFFLYFFYV